MSRHASTLPARHTVDASQAPANREQQHAQRTRDPDTAPDTLSNHAIGQALGAGAPLEPQVRAEMEQRFGTSFADVRVHDDERAHRSAAELEAKAYTHGSDIAFSAGRYAPQQADGRQLLAHELAHVVQQRRGGPAPELAPSAAHEVGADQSAAQVAAGAPNVTVPGATGVGVARDIDDEKKASRLPRSTAGGDLPFGDATRALHPGVDYWQTHTPDVSAMTALELRDEAEQIKEKLFIQTQCSPETLRLEQVGDLFEQAIRKLPQATAPKAKKKRQREGDARRPAPKATTPNPRPPLPQRFATTTNPEQLARDYSDIVTGLAREDLTGKERADLQAELDSIEPLVAQELSRRSALRYGDLIDQALTPENRYYGNDTPLIEHMRRIASIMPDEHNPGMNLLTHGHEQIPVSDVALKAIRANAMHGLNQMAADVRDANEQVIGDYTDLMERTFEKHKYVGAISMVRSGENPAEWEEKLVPIVGTSNQLINEYFGLRKAASDPWNAAPPSLLDMAQKVDAGERVGEGARNYLDYRTGQLYEGTIGAIRHLGRMKAAGQVAANFAFTPAGAALYGATESTLEQLSEMHYGQREHFDYLAPVVDAASAYVGGKVTGGLSGLGKNAPLWVRAAAFVPADRLGAAATTLTHGTLDRALNRSDQGFSGIMGDTFAELTDWKQAGFNLAMLGLGHAVKSGRGGGARELPSGAPKEIARVNEALPEAQANKAISINEPARSGQAADNPASFGDASFDALVREVSNSAFGQHLETAKQTPPVPLREDTTHSRAKVDEIAHSNARRNPPPGQVPGAQIQHDTKTLDVTRNLPAGMFPLHPDVINENLRWLQSRSDLPATELLIDPNGAGTRYFVDTIPRGRAGDFGMPGHQPELFPETRAADKTYSTEHKFADAHLIPTQAEKIAQSRRDAGLLPLDPRMLAISAGEMARWQTTGHSGTERSGRNIDLAGAASQRALSEPALPAPSPQLSLPLFDYLLRAKRPN
ncbi:hypothetical protein HDG40_007324 [Paraburkholderia sp. JPY158]|uniref:eCIS core domain-containing protein n=1 Tax=Paraburkholderia atlantica TaxID=2654982 RepID=A0A7W8VAS2_PARAM|nr:DUF4157 domain-containing protein [Paraburkholderia atlantica]MBB5429129.1 hypothetical protein [Paraburkholderia atlantica]